MTRHESMFLDTIEACVVTKGLRNWPLTVKSTNDIKVLENLHVASEVLKAFTQNC